jgi:hypothetical protein
MMSDTKIILKTVVDSQKSLKQELVRRIDKTDKMLRAVINGQSSMKSDLLGEIGKVRLGVKVVDQKVDRLDKKLTKRIDKIGLQLASLEDDAPTIEEFNELEEKVTVLEQASPN